MDKQVIYGITFLQDKISDNYILLRPSYIIEGSVYEKVLIDKYENVYTKINLNTLEKNGSCSYGFGVDEATLLEYYKKNGYKEGEYGYVDVCAKFYLEMIQKHVFVVKNENDKRICYAYNLENQKTFQVDLRQNAFAFIDDKAIETKNENSSKEEINCDAINEREVSNGIDINKIIQNISQRVIAQDEAVEALVIAVCRNKKFVDYDMNGNVLMYGPTGCGKTELAKSLANELNVPFIAEDLSHYTASGYSGDSIKQILRRLYIVSGKNMDKAEQAIVLLDEFDKLASTSSLNTVNKTDVQYELLKVIEGAEVNINDSNKETVPLIMDTSNITFILAGAFTDLYDVKNKNHIGFNSKEENMEVQALTTKDLKRYGIIKEIVGRISLKIPIKQLHAKEFEEILSKSSISRLKKYERAFLNVDKVKIVYEDREEFIATIAKKAETEDVGARGLTAIVDEVFSKAFKKISESLPVERELIVSSRTVEDPSDFELIRVEPKTLTENNGYTLKKVRRDLNELPKRIEEANS